MASKSVQKRPDAEPAKAGRFRSVEIIAGYFDSYPILPALAV